MKLIIVMTLVMYVGLIQAQINTNLLHLNNNTNTEMSGINPLGGSVLYGTTNNSLFQKDVDKWIQLRQELKMCNDQLSILNGNSVELDGLGSNYGRTIVWKGSKWQSNDFLNIDTLAGLAELNNPNLISTLNQTSVVELHNTAEMILEGRYLYVLGVSTNSYLGGSGAIHAQGGLEIIDVSSGSLIHEGSIRAWNGTTLDLGNVRSFCKKGDYVYIACAKGPSIVDITDISNPTHVISYNELIFDPQTGTWDYCSPLVRNYENYIYYVHKNRLIIYEITDNGTTLTKVNTIHDINIDPVVDMIVENNRLFILGYNSEFEGHIIAVDLSNPVYPTLHSKDHSSSFPIHTISSRTAKIKDNRLYFANHTTYSGSQNRLITVVDITDISNMTVSSFINYDEIGLGGYKLFDDLEIVDNFLIGFGELYENFVSNFHYAAVFDITNPNSIIYTDIVHQPPSPLEASDFNQNQVVKFRNDTFYVGVEHHYVYNYKIDRRNFTPNVNIGVPSSNNALTVNGNASKQGGGNWLGYSDQRLKKNIRPYTKGLDVIRKINPYQFNYRSNSAYSDTNSIFTGVMAQEMQYILPESVQAVDDTKGSSGLKDKLQFNSSPILWNLLNALKELKNEQDEIEKSIKQLSDEK